MTRNFAVVLVHGGAALLMAPLFAQESVDDLVRKLKGQAGAAAPASPTVPSAPLTPQVGPPAQKSQPTAKPKGFVTRGGRTQPATGLPRMATRSVRFSGRGIPKNIEAASQSGSVEVKQVSVSHEPSPRGIQEPPLPTGEKSYEIRYQVDPLSQVTRRTILFQADSTEFADAASTVEIAKLAQAFKNPELKAFTFVIEGHSSAEGAEAHNLDLSNRRAIAIVKALIGHGVPENQLIPVGFGESDSKHPYSAPETLRAMDRRVEIFRLER